MVRPLHCHWLLLKVHRSTQGHKDTIWPEGGSYIKDKIIKLLISFTPSAASYPLGGIINPPAPPESSGWHKKNSQAFKSSPLNMPLVPPPLPHVLFFSAEHWLSLWRPQPWGPRVVVTGQDSSRSPLSGRIRPTFSGWLGEASWPPYLASIGFPPYDRTDKATIKFGHEVQLWWFVEF